MYWRRRNRHFGSYFRRAMPYGYRKETFGNLDICTFSKAQFRLLNVKALLENISYKPAEVELLRRLKCNKPMNYSDLNFFVRYCAAINKRVFKNYPEVARGFEKQVNRISYVDLAKIANKNERLAPMKYCGENHIMNILAKKLINEFIKNDHKKWKYGFFFAAIKNHSKELFNLAKYFVNNNIWYNQDFFISLFATLDSEQKYIIINKIMASNSNVFKASLLMVGNLPKHLQKQCFLSWTKLHGINNFLITDKIDTDWVLGIKNAAIIKKIFSAFFLHKVSKHVYPFTKCIKKEEMTSLLFPIMMYNATKTRRIMALHNISWRKERQTVKKQHK